MQQTETLNLAESIHREIKTNRKSYKELEEMFGLTRPHIINHLKLLSLPDKVKHYFLEGHMNFKPLLDAYDLYGDSLLVALDICVKKNSTLPEGKSKKVTFPQLQQLMSPSQHKSNTHKSPSSAPTLDLPICKDSIAADITSIKRILHESEKSSSGYSALVLSTHSNTLIHELLKSIEGSLNLNSQEINHAVVFNTEVDDSMTITLTGLHHIDEFDQSPQINIEDISQDFI